MILNINIIFKDKILYILDIFYYNHNNLFKNKKLIKF